MFLTVTCGVQACRSLLVRKVVKRMSWMKGNPALGMPRWFPKVVEGEVEAEGDKPQRSGDDDSCAGQEASDFHRTDDVHLHC